MENRVISFHYTLTSKEGVILDSSRESQPMIYLEGSGQIIPGLEVALSVLKEGDKRKITVHAADAYGSRDEQLVVQVPRTQLPKTDVKVGDQFEADTEGDAPLFTVVAADTTHVTLDGNHPMAGQDLFFDIEVTHVRKATKEELTHGHAHGPGGHTH